MLGSHNITTRAVVINRAPSGEGSARIFLYTEQFGLLGALAKSAREERSKLRPHLQLGTFGMYTLVKGQREWRITGATDTENSYFQLFEKAYAQQASARVCGMVRLLVHGEDLNQNLFQALWGFLEHLPQVAEKETHIAEPLAVLRILYTLGYVGEGHAIPHMQNFRYDEAVFADVAPHKKQLVHTINEALFASNLN